MVLLGTIVNALSVILGALLGRVFKNIPEKIKTTIMSGIGLAVTVMGLQMGFKSEQFLIVILSLVIGAIIGEWIDLENQLNKLGLWIESKVKAKEGTSISQGFVTATLIFCIGAMAILGALDSGIRNDHNILYTKALLDGFTSIILSSTIGIGVLFSAVPIFLYQGSIAGLATHIDKWVPTELMELFIAEMTATGGIMIVAIGLNLLNITKIRIANLLPGIPVVFILVSIYYYFL